MGLFAVETPVYKDAVLSEDGRYRYSLTREWDFGSNVLTFIMLNPSTADASLDDPTIRRCISFAKRENFGGLNVVNLYAFRATEPKDMKRAIDPVGPRNDEFIRQTIGPTGSAVAAWGTHADPRRVRQVVSLLPDVSFMCLGKTKDGHPKHPLYIKGDQPFVGWSL